MEALVLHTGTPIVHWEDNTSCIYFVEAKRVTPRVYRKNLTLVSFFQNMQSPVSCQLICAPNHVQDL